MGIYTYNRELDEAFGDTLDVYKAMNIAYDLVSAVKDAFEKNEDGVLLSDDARSEVNDTLDSIYLSMCGFTRMLRDYEGEERDRLNEEGWNV